VASNGLSGGRQRTLQNIDVAAQAGRALRPFILRRTKQQVLHELPEKTDQTLLCTMEEEQRKIYDQLLRHYQTTLLGTVRSVPGAGLGAPTFMVLEALLRLRQAACHPGLIDPQHASRASAKLETLMEHLGQLVDEGHKALVFSQFTSMLALVRKSLDDNGIKYEYLDGKTRDRKQRIDHFQSDPECSIFLISLKAGGLGLNLTAANYVFILDPWWNPAVEIQAIDRAHRIGQTQHVFAYRLICEDTVEQRIAELQNKKRKLADAIVGGESNLLRSLTREDLERLLS
ncbi:MAG: DEAD/DEAH box helicase, partial [Pirellulaceae bacterium]|nr:DEAD/DEAH box helicase [Pirellulaceae bacterium]